MIMMVKIKNIYLCDKQWIKEVEKLTWEKYECNWWIIFEWEDWEFYEHITTDPVFPFWKLK